MRHEFAVEELAELERRGLLRRLRAVDGPQDRAVRVDGRTVVNFSSNNYLGLANHPTLAGAAATRAADTGTGSGASRLIVGNMEPHRRLEQALSGYFGAESALLFNSGYQANLGVLQTLAGRDDAIYSDALNHASIIDGCRLSRAAVHVYRHGDPADLDRQLAATGRDARRRVVVSDSLFSMDGDCAPVRELASVAREHDALLIVDEAHAVGALGPGGRGVAARAGIEPDVLVGTLGKAFGGFGAFAASSRPIVRLLENRARSFVFTTALPPGVVEASAAALDLSGGPRGDELRERLVNNVHRLARGLLSRSLIEQKTEYTHIFPIIVGDDRAAMKAADVLLQAGYFAQGIRPPTVPAGTARLRVAVMATHSTDDIDGLLGAFDRLIDADLLPGGSS